MKEHFAVVVRATDSYFNLLLFDGQTAAQTHEVSAIVPFNSWIYQVEWFGDTTAVATNDVTYATLQTKSGLSGMYTNVGTAPIDLGVISMFGMGQINGAMTNFFHPVKWKVGAGSPLYMRFITGATAGTRYVHCLVSLMRA